MMLKSPVQWVATNVEKRQSFCVQYYLFMHHMYSTYYTLSTIHVFYNRQEWKMEQSNKFLFVYFQKYKEKRNESISNDLHTQHRKVKCAHWRNVVVVVAIAANDDIIHILSKYWMRNDQIISTKCKWCEIGHMASNSKRMNLCYVCMGGDYICMRSSSSSIFHSISVWILGAYLFFFFFLAAWI